MSTLHEQVSEAILTAVTKVDGTVPDLTDEDRGQLADLTGKLVALYAADLRELAAWHDEQATTETRELDLWSGKATGLRTLPGSQAEREMDTQWTATMGRRKVHEQAAGRLRAHADELIASQAVRS